MIVKIVLLGAAVALSLFAAICVRASDEAEETLARICDKSAQGKDSDSVPVLVEPNEVLKLIKTYKANPSLCPWEYKESIVNLEQVLSDKVLSDICSLETFEILRKYHKEHVHYFTPELNEYEIKQKKRLMKGNRVRSIRPTPEALRRFFILFAKQINSNCRLAIPNQLARLSHELNLDAELDMIVKLRKNAKKTIRRALFSDTVNRKRRGNLNLEELQMLDIVNSRLYVNVPPDNPLWKLRDVCSNRLRPLYNEVFTSVIKLNSLNYREQIYSGIEVGEKLKDDPTITRWYGIIQICELIKDIAVINREDTPIGLVKEENVKHRSEEDSDSDDDDDGDERGNNIPSTNVPKIQFNHEKIAYKTVFPIDTSDSDVNSSEFAKKEVKKFDRATKISVLERTNYFLLLRYDSKLFFGIMWNTFASRADDIKKGVVRWMIKNGLLTKRTAAEAVVFTVILIALIATIAAHG